MIIIDLVFSTKKDEHNLTKTKLFNDMMMMFWLLEKRGTRKNGRSSS